MDRRTDLRRRTLLTGLGTATAATFAGCVADSTGTDSDASTDTPTDGSTEAPDDSDRPEFDPASDAPAWTLSVGDRDGIAFPENAKPIRARVWNDGPERDVRIAVIRDGDEGAPLHLEAISLAADAFLTVAFEEPGAYELRIGVDGGDPVSVAEYDPGTFDCNDTATTVQIAEDGSVLASTVSTSVGCPGPSVVASEFEQGQGDCGGEQSATVSLDRDRVVVEGRVVTPVPCYDLELEAVDYDSDANRLTVDVAPDERQDGICVECVGIVAYEAAVTFERAIPGAVRIRHREDGELVTVATS